MKKIFLNLLIISSLFSYSQTENEDFEQMVEAEMKSASSTINFRANLNTQDYDVTYHELRFTVDPAVYFINGDVNTTFTALSDMNTVTFDMANELTASSVTINSIPAPFTQNGNNEIIITLPATLITGNSQTVRIIYSGAPPVSGFSAFATQNHAGNPGLWTLSEPYGARDWWPCKQDLSDKIASIDVYITAPSVNISVSNGLQQSVIDNGNGTKTTHFHHGYPIPAYLIAIATTNYQIYNQQA
ncbi:MAG: peptidase M1, partial [Flavobacterium sp.]